jgi:hypothetical protein
VGIDEGRENRINLGHFQSPQPAGLFRSHAQLRGLLELLANELDPFTHAAGADGVCRGGDGHCCLAGCVAGSFPMDLLRECVQEIDQLA